MVNTVSNIVCNDLVTAWSRASFGVALFGRRLQHREIVSPFDACHCVMLI